jgi:hypothetical protein
MSTIKLAPLGDGLQLAGAAGLGDTNTSSSGLPPLKGSSHSASTGSGGLGSTGGLKLGGPKMSAFLPATTGLLQPADLLAFDDETDGTFDNSEFVDNTTYDETDQGNDDAHVDDDKYYQQYETDHNPQVESRYAAQRHEDRADAIGDDTNAAAQQQHEEEQEEEQEEEEAEAVIEERVQITRFALRYSPPTMIVLYEDTKYDCKRRKKILVQFEGDVESTVRALQSAYPIYLGDNVANSRQLKKLVRMLQLHSQSELALAQSAVQQPIAEEGDQVQEEAGAEEEEEEQEEEEEEEQEEEQEEQEEEQEEQEEEQEEQEEEQEEEPEQQVDEIPREIDFNQGAAEPEQEQEVEEFEEEFEFHPDAAQDFGADAYAAYDEDGFQEEDTEDVVEDEAIAKAPALTEESSHVAETTVEPAGIVGAAVDINEYEDDFEFNNEPVVEIEHASGDDNEEEDDSIEIDIQEQSVDASMQVNDQSTEKQQHAPIDIAALQAEDALQFDTNDNFQVEDELDLDLPEFDAEDDASNGNADIENSFAAEDVDPVPQDNNVKQDNDTDTPSATGQLPKLTETTSSLSHVISDMGASDAVMDDLLGSDFEFGDEFDDDEDAVQFSVNDEGDDEDDLMF